MDHDHLGIRVSVSEYTSSKKNNQEKKSFSFKNVYILWLSKNLSKGKNPKYAKIYWQNMYQNIIYNGWKLVTT